MKRLTCSILVLATGAGMMSPALGAGGVPPAEGSIALISKVVLDVSRKEAGKTWLAAKKGETLSSGDMVKTGGKSLAILKFKDNSLVRVRELSELTITGLTSGSAFSKSVQVRTGVVGFNIRKQLDKEDFRFSSPTSVASIRGTRGIFIVSRLADTLVVLEGLVNLLNSISSRSVDVRAGFTGISRADGTILTRPSTAAEQEAAELVSRLNDQENRLELDLRDGQGNTKRLKIDYRE